MVILATMAIVSKTTARSSKTPYSLPAHLTRNKRAFVVLFTSLLSDFLTSELALMTLTEPASHSQPTRF